MSENLGSGVSRVLDPTGTSYLEVIWQEGKPPLDSELNLIQAIDKEWRRIMVLRGSPSGWLGNETNNFADFITNGNWSNWFRYGRQRAAETKAIMWACVNGWLVPVTATRTGTPPGSPNDVDTWNVIALDPPPSNAGDARVDFAFLEVWLARIPPNPSTLNKPSASAVYRYGNVESGNSFLADDLQDPAIGFETTERVQLQYRIRVAKGLVGLTTNPDGFDPTVVFGQGSAASPTSFTFANMRKALGDPGLWRAGDGTPNALGTVDGYVYAIPLAGIFRRNSVTWNGDPNQNLNGGFNRNPLAVDRTGIQTYSTVPTLAADLSATATSVALVNATNIPLPTTPATPVLIQIGDELLTYNAITGTTLGGLTRAQNGTRGDFHKSGSTVQVISGRPDGLFADQIAATDVLDMRHVVNPGGFDFKAILQNNLDKLLRGTLRSNWKRSGAGPQGPFVFYQDKISSTVPSLGVTKLDAPDGIRQVFSDAASIQTVDCIITPTGTVAPSIVSTTGFSLGIPVTQTVQTTVSAFTGDNTTGDEFVFPVASLKTGVSGGDADQIRWVNDGLAGAVVLRIDGQTTPVPTNLYSVTPANPGPNDNLTIKLLTGFPTMTAPQILYVTVNCMYGPGRGLSRRANSLHNITFVQPSTELLLTPTGVPATNFPVKTSWAPLWSKYRNTSYKRNVPITSSAYADLGSKTVIVSPFRRIIWPTNLFTVDGTAANPYDLPATAAGTTGSSTGTTTFTDANALFTPSVVAGAAILRIAPPPGAPPGPPPEPFIVPFGASVTSTTVDVDRTIPAGTGLTYEVISPNVANNQGSSTGGTTLTDTSGVNLSGAGVTPGMAVIILNGSQPGRYTVQIGSIVTATTVTLDRSVPVGTGLLYYILPAQGLMPTKAADGITAKWLTTDPLLLFSVSTDNASTGFANTRNIYVSLPRSYVPNWGEVNVPILPVDGTTFNEGINFMLLSNKGAAPVDGDKNYVAYASYSGQTSYTWASFTTTTFTAGPAPYNGLVSISGGGNLAGMQFFVDPLGLGRTGLQLPPFYGVARLFGVYEAGDYFLNRSAYNGSDRTRLGSGGAVNLLRQGVKTPTFWIETDVDGDATFVINSDVIDITKSVLNPITSFAAGNYVIEASIFGFDRGAFDVTKEFRLCLSRTRAVAQAGNTTLRYGGGGNVGVPISGATSVLPGPATPTDSILVNYSRTPYQGDAFGSQTNYVDIGQYLGPIQSATAFQVSSTGLTENALTRPNQKAVEVLASVGFATTLGTGRLSGDSGPPNSVDFRNVGYEDPAVYPPASGADPRPRTLVNALDDDLTEIGTQYLGATERLPLGSLFRDKDFKGGTLGLSNGNPAPLSFFNDSGEAMFHSNLTATSAYEQTEVSLDTASTGTGTPGDLVAQVDGEPSNYSLLVNFRVTRGGSAFMANGAHPGGEIAIEHPAVSAVAGHSNVLEGRAMLVRNSVTNVGASEVNAGDELMMLIITNVQQLKDTNPHPGVVLIGTNGSNEGYAAADLYRLEGHPISNDHVRVDTDPSTVTLSKRVA